MWRKILVDVVVAIFQTVCRKFRTVVLFLVCQASNVFVIVLWLIFVNIQWSSLVKNFANRRTDPRLTLFISCCVVNLCQNNLFITRLSFKSRGRGCPYFPHLINIPLLYQVSEPLPPLPQLRTFPPIIHVFVPTPPPVDIVINFENKNTSFLEVARQLNVRFGSRIFKGCDLQSSRSCKGRSGTWGRNKRLKCYCDDLCQDIGDCCYDYYNR